MADHLCVNCSMCCDGTLFSRAAVTQEEIETFDMRGEFFTKPDGALRMRLGCVHLGNDGACQKYETGRPKICHTYKCRLLKKVEAGEVPESEAIEIAREIREAETKTRIHAAKAMGNMPYSNRIGTVHDAIKQLEAAQTDDEPSNGYFHAMVCYDYFVNLVRVHLKPNFGQSD